MWWPCPTPHAERLSARRPSRPTGHNNRGGCGRDPLLTWRLRAGPAADVAHLRVTWWLRAGPKDPADVVCETGERRERGGAMRRSPCCFDFLFALRTASEGCQLDTHRANACGQMCRTRGSHPCGDPMVSWLAVVGPCRSLKPRGSLWKVVGARSFQSSVGMAEVSISKCR